MARAGVGSAGLVDIDLHFKATFRALDGDALKLAAGFHADPADLPPAVRTQDRALLIYDKFTTVYLLLQGFSAPSPKNNT